MQPSVPASGWRRFGAARRLPPETRRYQILLLAVLAVAVAAVASATPAFRLIDARIFDYLSTLAPPTPDARTPIVVAIDEPSMAEIGRQWPWPRDLHARLVDALRDAGAAAIGLDIIFSEPSVSPEADAVLAAALGPDVVLAGDESLVEMPQGDQIIRAEPLPAFTASGALTGIASIPLDSDGTFRRLPAYPDGFARQLLTAAGRPVTEPEPGARLQVFGPARTIPTVSYYQALDPAAFLPEGLFRDRIVIIGLSMQSAPSVDQGGADMHPTSWTLVSGRLVSGAEIHASIIENLSRGLAIGRSGPWTMIGATILAALLAAASVWRRSGAVTLFLTLAGLLALVAGAFAVLRFGRVYLAPSGPALAMIVVAGSQSALDFARERRMRAGIVRAFSQYLSPVLVERLAERPELLNLGGERRELTVLFCDVRGFTTVAERLKDDPERLTTLMNRLITPLSEAVLAEGGTIDKYIGDCVMAFWNAPLDMADHPVRGVRAALGMLDAIDRLNKELAAEARVADENPVTLRIGVGVNTGDCVVGNMGSTMRFAYTAMGDPVNLASRLESESKAMRLPLLIGEATARRLHPEFSLVPLHRISVKGKSEPVCPFTVLRGEPLAPEDSEHHRAIIEALDQGIAIQEAAPSALATRYPELAGYYDVAMERHPA